MDDERIPNRERGAELPSLAEGANDSRIALDGKPPWLLAYVS